MNYLAHALPFLDRPYVAAGTAVPDWLAVADRSVRMRMRFVEPHLAADDATRAAVAAGIRQHLLDDARFHETRAFAEVSLGLTVLARDALAGEPNFRPGFLGHLLTEVLLDAALAESDDTLLDRYYACLARVEPRSVVAAVNGIAPRPARNLEYFIDEFLRLRILNDYADDGRLMMRLNQVMRRVRLGELPATFVAVLPDARALLRRRRAELLDGIPVDAQPWAKNPGADGRESGESDSHESPANPSLGGERRSGGAVDKHRHGR